MAACISCEQITDKYKCSKCAAAYCSLDCYKTHKDSTICAELAKTLCAQQTRPGCNATAAEEEPTIYAPFKTEDTVPLAQLQQLANSEPLRQLLYNPHLRTLLRQIDVAHNPQLTMTAAMQEPLFIEFANACLKVVEPMSESEHAELQLYT